MTYPDPQTKLLCLGLDDMLQLFEVMSIVGFHLDKDPQDDLTIMRPTLDVVGGLLESEFVVAGDVVKDDQGFLTIRSWDLSPPATVDRIEKEWHELGGPPNLGDIVWLELTDKGRAEARRWLSENQ